MLSGAQRAIRKDKPHAYGRHAATSLTPDNHSSLQQTSGHRRETEEEEEIEEEQEYDSAIDHTKDPDLLNSNLSHGLAATLPQKYIMYPSGNVNREEVKLSKSVVKTN